MSLGAQKGQARGGLWPSVIQGQLKGLSLSVEVDGLSSGDSETLDSKLRAALEADKFPDIVFVMDGYEIRGDEVLARGQLTIHGVSKDVELKGHIASVAEGVRVKGSTDLLMSDYGVKPPVMLLGLLRVDDKLTVQYDMLLKPSPWIWNILRR